MNIITETNELLSTPYMDFCQQSGNYCMIDCKFLVEINLLLLNPKILEILEKCSIFSKSLQKFPKDYNKP